MQQYFQSTREINTLQINLNETTLNFGRNDFKGGFCLVFKYRDRPTIDQRTLFDFVVMQVYNATWIYARNQTNTFRLNGSLTTQMFNKKV